MPVEVRFQLYLSVLGTFLINKNTSSLVSIFIHKSPFLLNGITRLAWDFCFDLYLASTARIKFGF